MPSRLGRVLSFCVAALIAAAPPAAGAEDDWRAPPREILFAGGPEEALLPHSAHGGDFASHARYEAGALIIEVPAGAAWGKVGLFSPEPVIWLDDFGGDAEVRVTATVDPSRTSGFAFALASPGWGGVAGNDPGSPSVRFYWTRYAHGTGALAQLHVDPHRQDDFWREEVGPEAPAEVALVLRPGSVALEIDGEERTRRSWDVPGEGSGFRLYLFSHPQEAHQPVSLALQEIRVERTYGGLPQGPLEDVEPLPVTLVFDGTPTPPWEPAATAGGDFEAFARWEEGVLVVEVPEGREWGKTGLLSAEPLILLDRRAERSALRLTLKVDPARTGNFVVALSGGKNAEMWHDHVVWFGFGRRVAQDDWAMGLRISPYHDWTRPLDRDGLLAEWDGTIHYDIGPGWAAMRLPGGPSVRGEVSTVVGAPYYVTVLAHAPDYNLPTGLALERMDLGIAPPAGMSALERWYLVEEAAFDPQLFLQDLAAEAWRPLESE